jgi:hypothetical protein
VRASRERELELDGERLLGYRNTPNADELLRLGIANNQPPVGNLFQWVERRNGDNLGRSFLFFFVILVSAAQSYSQSDGLCGGVFICFFEFMGNL